MIFDGKHLANQLVVRLKTEIGDRILKLVIVVDPNNEAGMKYSQLKQAMADKLGVDFEIKQTINPQVANKIIAHANSDQSVNGIMIQLPFPNSSELINLITPTKDIDGLRNDSLYLPAVVRAVIKILDEAKGMDKSKLVVGNNGQIGSRIQTALQTDGFDKVDWKEGLVKLSTADVVISCTGQASVITPDMVKQGVIAIDIGYPKGDFDPRVADKAAFFTPVPGGVGPVTVVMLFKNLIDSISQ